VWRGLHGKAWVKYQGLHREGLWIAWRGHQLLHRAQRFALRRHRLVP
jgi:hypothetical protein